MKIAIIGTRGIPAKYGGFETFAEEISQLFAENGFEVTVQCDRNNQRASQWKGVRLYYSPVTKSENPLRYYFNGIMWGFKNCDIVILAGTPGSIFYYLNIFYKKIIITNTDGIESRRLKWGYIHRLYLKFSEFLAVSKSDYIVADSLSIRSYLLNTYRIPDQKIWLVEYGAHINNKYESKVLEKYKLKVFGYYLIVCRIEPENNLTMIIEGYEKSLTSLPLVIVGHIKTNKYDTSLVKKYHSDKIIFMGGIYDKKELDSLRYACRAYIHGHSVGGTNPSLLEAMGNRNIIICHDNEFNREVTDNSQLYFSNSSDCTDQIQFLEKMTEEEIEIYRQKAVNRIKGYYNWERIFNKYKENFDLIKPENKNKTA